jgi:hypothetical protein
VSSWQFSFSGYQQNCAFDGAGRHGVPKILVLAAKEKSAGLAGAFV